jgi:hypothetical protein
MVKDEAETNQWLGVVWLTQDRKDESKKGGKKLVLLFLV